MKQIFILTQPLLTDKGRRGYQIIKRWLRSRKPEKGHLPTLRCVFQCLKVTPHPMEEEPCQKTVMLKSGEQCLSLLLGMDRHCQHRLGQLSISSTSVSHGPCPNRVTIQRISFMLTFWDCLMDSIRINF